MCGFKIVAHGNRKTLMIPNYGHRLTPYAMPIYFCIPDSNNNMFLTEQINAIFTDMFNNLQYWIKDKMNKEMWEYPCGSWPSDIVSVAVSGAEMYYVIHLKILGCSSLDPAGVFVSVLMAFSTTSREVHGEQPISRLCI